jgi:peroxiredoxin/uncharacterized membrane protein YphA (DoxX/SURF4 family)
MSILLLLARLVLVVVFLVAGVGKLLDLKGSRQAIRDFGLPGFLAAPLGILLPIAELIVAVALVPAQSAWWAAIAAGVLLLLFVAGITYNLTLGRKPDCHCFGVFYSSAISKNTVIRNLVLAAVAGFIVAFGPINAEISMVAWIGTLTVAEGVGLVFGILVAILLAFETWFLFEMMRQVGKLTLRLEAVESGASSSTQADADPDWVGLPEDTDGPAFALPDLDGEIVTLESLVARGKPTVLVFTSAVCGPCEAMMPELGQWIRDYSHLFTFAVIGQGSAEINRAKTAEYGVAPVLLQQDREVAEAYLVRGTPSAVILRIDGSIYSSLAEGEDEIRALIEEDINSPVKPSIDLPTVNVLGQPNETAFAEIGVPAPDISLPDVNGDTIKLSNFLGNPALMIFWNTGCGYCEAMLRDLKAWENKPPKGAPQLVFISAGSASDIKKQGMRSPVMLDDSFSIASLFKVSGTPSAVLLDENGTVTGRPAVGADDIFQLANSTARKYAKGKPKPAAV